MDNDSVATVTRSQDPLLATSIGGLGSVIVTAAKTRRSE
jgi:hypothetical protein